MRLLVLSPAFYGYGRSIARAFQTLGCETAYGEYGAPSAGIGAVFRYAIPRRLGLDVEREPRTMFAREMGEKIQSFRPDGILVVRGDFYSELLHAMMRAVATRPKTVIWLMDAVKRIPRVMAYRCAFDEWFVFEPTDVGVLRREFGIRAEFLAVAFDSEHYRPLAPTESDPTLTADLSFVGMVMDSARRRTLDRLAAWALDHGRDFKVVTGSYRLCNYPRLLPYRSLRKCLWRSHLDHDEVNTLYNQCAVNVNVHIHQSIEGLNPRFFEILGSGGLQLVEEKAAQWSLGFVPDRDFLVYASPDEMKEKIEFALRYPDRARQIAASGHMQATAHDFVARAATILDRAFR